MFVYVLVGGVCGTCLLIMADVQGPDFWQITYPAFLLVCMGLATLHVERAFPEAEQGDFIRKNFGMAFFRAGHVLLTLGLLLILGAQLYGVLYWNDPWLLAHDFPAPAPITSELPLKVLALLLVLGGTYAYLYSELVVRRVGIYVSNAIVTLLWAQVLVIDLLQVSVSTELVILLLAATAITVNLVQPWLRPLKGEASGLWTRTSFPMGLILSLAPVLLGVGLHFRYLLFRPAGETYELGWTYPGAMLLTTISCILGAWLHRGLLPRVSGTYLFGAAASVLVGAAGTLAVLGLPTWVGQAPLLMLIPLSYLGLSWWLRHDAWQRPLLWAAQAATAVLLASSLVAMVEQLEQHSGIILGEAVAQGFIVQRGVPLNLSLAVFFAEAAVFYTLAGFYRRQALSIYLATAAGCAALWQLLSYGQVDDTWYILAFAIAGLALLIIHRMASLEHFQVTGLTGTCFHGANTLLAFSFTAGALISITHVAASGAALRWPILGMLTVLVAISLMAAALVKHATWRRVYVCAAIGQFALALGILAVFSQLTPWQKVELVSVLVGGGLLVLGHIGWYREQQKEQDLVSFSLFLGSLMVALALIVGTISWRTWGVFHWPDELALLVAGAVLFLTGMMFRLKSTTLAGVVQLMVWMATLLVYLPWSQWNLAAILLMAGGGSIFLIGLLLSVYRDRLLALPEQIRQRRSIFRVLSWR